MVVIQHNLPREKQTNKQPHQQANKTPLQTNKHKPKTKQKKPQTYAFLLSLLCLREHS